MDTFKLNYNLKVLLIEPDPDDAFLIKVMLIQTRGNPYRYELTVADTMAKGLQLLAVKEIEVVLLDVSLHDNHKLDYLTKVLTQAPHVSIIILTPFDDTLLAIKALQKGAQDYLVKDQLNRHILTRSIRYALERKQNLFRLEQSNDARLRQIVEMNADTIIIVDQEGIIRFINPAAEILFGRQARELVGEIFGFPIVNGRRTELDIVHPDGTLMVAEMRVVEIVWMKKFAYLASLRDITERKKIEMQLHHMAFHDPLTNLPNRNLLMAQLEKAIGYSKSHNDYLFAIIFLDLDRFKIINDSLGHLIGDKLLITIADRLRESIHPNHNITRFGGDEFAILLHDIQHIDEAIDIAKKIQLTIAKPVMLDDYEIVMKTSCGVVSGRGYEKPELILRDADTAMYEAKALGRGRCVLFNKRMYAQTMAKFKLETQLRQAVEQQAFKIFYQPIVSLTTQEITGVEALLRWQHPQRGLLSPVEFLPLIEETGLIIPLSKWVLYTICDQLQAWHNAGYNKLRASINISNRQFYWKGLPILIKSILEELNLSAKYLQLEVVEDVVSSKNDYNITFLQELIVMGLQVAIDDFGTGYSSLGRLRNLPIHTLKIDQSFVENIPHDKSDTALVTTIITMAHNLNLTVIAEGIETAEQLKFLSLQQCDKGQGFLFGRPMSPEAMTRQLQSGIVLNKSSPMLEVARL